MMGPGTLVLIFFSLCGFGVLLSLAAPASRQANVLTMLGGLAAITLVLAGANALWGGGTFRQPLWSLPGLARLTLVLRPALGSVLVHHGPSTFPSFDFCGR
jgi:hypothetical protein